MTTAYLAIKRPANSAELRLLTCISEHPAIPSFCRCIKPVSRHLQQWKDSWQALPMLKLQEGKKKGCEYNNPIHYGFHPRYNFLCLTEKQINKNIQTHTQTL